MGIHLTVSFLFSLAFQTMRQCCPFKINLPSLVKYFGKQLNRHTQGCVFMMILSPVQLTMSINPNSSQAEHPLSLAPGEPSMSRTQPQQLCTAVYDFIHIYIMFFKGHHIGKFQKHCLCEVYNLLSIFFSHVPQALPAILQNQPCSFHGRVRPERQSSSVDFMVRFL